MSRVVLGNTYLGNIQYYSHLAAADKAIIDLSTHYIKQTYRNRCTIATASGVMDLIIPVEKGCSSTKISDKDIKVAHNNWQRVHLAAIETAYNASPFWEYYMDDIQPFFLKQYHYLVDFTEPLRETICNLIGIKTEIQIADTFLEYPLAEDYRQTISPKTKEIDLLFKSVPYYQVFKEKNGFLSNLSIIDLLLNMGPESILILKQSHKRGCPN